MGPQARAKVPTVIDVNRVGMLEPELIRALLFEPGDSSMPTHQS
jgi:hypothetical protein